MKYLCGPRLRIVDRGTHVMHGLRVQWQNIRLVVVGAHKGPYKARTGARGWDGSGMM